MSNNSDIERALDGIRNTLQNQQPSSTEWYYPTLLNSWVAFDTTTYPTARYFKDSNGVVHLEGVVKNGTINTIGFILPVGFRPALRQHFPCVSNSAFGGVRVHATGEVYFWLGSNVWFDMDGVTFLAEA